MQAHEVHIEDEENSDGVEVCRWACRCGRSGHWTPARERPLVAIRGDAHKLRYRKKRPTKAQRSRGREAGPGEYAELRDVLRLGGL